MNVKFIEDGSDVLAYFPETLRFFKISQSSRTIIEKIDKGEEYEAMKDTGLSEEGYQQMKKKVNECKTYISPVNPSNQKMKRRLGKLVLNISNKCNLRCRYCYANGGTYLSDEDIMSEEVAKKTLDKFYEEYGMINVIQIFGGEPTMNMPLIKFICEYVKQKNKTLEEETKIGIVTNGTLISDYFIELVKEYSMNVTVSYDGHPEVNDMMRIYENGKGTSDKILSNVKRLKEATGQPSTIEVTYNQNHVNKGISVMDIIKFIRNTVGNIPLHIVPAGGEDQCSYVLKNRDEFIKSVDDIFNENMEAKGVDVYTYSLVQRIVNSLVTKRYSKYICEAGIGTISVSTKGDVYPCFMFTDSDDFILGNIYDEDLFKSDNFVNGIKKYAKFNKEENQECKKCYIRKSCNGCLGINYLETGNAFKLSNISCEMYRAMTERVIINLYRLNSKKESGADGITA